MRRFSILVLALPLAASACGDDEVDPVFLGAIEAGPGKDATPDVEQPEPATLGRSPCPFPKLNGTDIANTVRSIATFENRALITQPGFVRAVKLEDPDGCPGAPIASFGTGGSLAIDATAAVPLPDTRNVVAVSEGTLVLDSTGAEVGRCQTNGKDFVARLLHADAEGHVLAAFTKAPVSKLTVDSNTPAGCSAETFDLSSPFVFVQVAIARDGGFITVEQASATSPLVAARYDAAGQLISSSELLAAQGPSRLCSATGLVDTPKGIFVTDTTCRRVVLFEETESVAPSDLKVLRVAAELTFQNSPVGAALTPAESSVLVAVCQASEGGAVATFERIELP